MKEAVLDASVVLKWFTPREARAEPARSFRAAFDAGELRVIVPPLLFMEIINVAARRWRWNRKSLIELATALSDLPFDSEMPPLRGIAQWTAHGLTAYDAAYVSLAEHRRIPLITDDQQICAVAPRVARPLASCARRPPETH